jgi:tetratricopeptide (TPR) repeat protein
MVQGASVDYKQAVRYLDCAIKITPGFFNAYSIKGSLYGAIGLGKNGSNIIDPDILQESVSILLKSYDLYPYNLNTIVPLAVLYLYLHDYKNCLKMIDEMLAKFPIEQISKEIPIKDLKILKDECLKNLGGENNSDENQSTIPKIGIK